MDFDANGIAIYVCPECAQEKPLTEYYLNKRGKPNGRCKLCMRLYQAERYRRHGREPAWTPERRAEFSAQMKVVMRRPETLAKCRAAGKKRAQSLSGKAQIKGAIAKAKAASLRKKAETINPRSITQWKIAAIEMRQGHGARLFALLDACS